MEEKAEFDRIEELLESKMEYWSFSGLLQKVYNGTELFRKDFPINFQNMTEKKTGRQWNGK